MVTIKRFYLVKREMETGVIRANEMFMIFMNAQLACWCKDLPSSAPLLSINLVGVEVNSTLADCSEGAAGAKIFAPTNRLQGD